jgi:hypothetical protein
MSVSQMLVMRLLLTPHGEHIPDPVTTATLPSKLQLGIAVDMMIGM